MIENILSWHAHAVKLHIRQLEDHKQVDRRSLLNTHVGLSSFNIDITVTDMHIMIYLLFKLEL